MKLLTATLTFALVSISASTAMAGCSPSCVSPKICMYEAAGGSYYCGKPKGSSLLGGTKIIDGGTVNRPTVVNGPVTKPVTTGIGNN